MTPLFLLRHGPVDSPVGGGPIGRQDLLVNNGAKELWPSVKEELLALGIQRLLTSDLRRAKDHALDLGLPTLVLPDLGEQGFGEWEGSSWSEIKGAETFFANPMLTTPPGGESYARCASRSLLALQGALEGEQATLVLAHGGPLRAIVAHFLGLSLERSLDLGWQFFGLTRLDLISANRAILRYHNRALPSQGIGNA